MVTCNCHHFDYQVFFFTLNNKTKFLYSITPFVKRSKNELDIASKLSLCDFQNFCVDRLLPFL